MRRHFHKMHGLGNDFVIVDARQEPFAVTPAVARAVADRRTGVGCDQLIVLEPSDRADLRMRIWNSDGGEVESCGNATRCVIQLTGAGTVDTDGGLLMGETLACGTGACASAVAAIASRRAQSPVTVDMTGGSLIVSWAPGEPIRMRGGATHVFEGELDLKALG